MNQSEYNYTHTNKLLSLIIPSYNMEDYLDHCLTSLIVGDADSELMQQLEVLVVNDGSTDTTSLIAHRYEIQYPQTFRVIDKENGNYGSCINAALPLVTGKYVKVLDADDSFDTEVFSRFLAFLQTAEVDMVFSDFERVNPEGKRLKTAKFSFPSMRLLAVHDYPLTSVHFYMQSVTYRVSPFDGLDYRQTEGIYYTDFEWIFLPMSRVKTFIYYPFMLYIYLTGRNGQSMDPIIRSRCFDMRLKVMYSVLELYQLCLYEGSKRNGIPVDIDYLHYRCLFLIRIMYYSCLKNQKKAQDASLLQDMDDTIHQRYPDIYRQLDDLHHYNVYFPKQKLPFRIIHCWHKYGSTISIIQMWIIRIVQGLTIRVARFLGVVI